MMVYLYNSAQNTTEKTNAYKDPHYVALPMSMSARDDTATAMLICLSENGRIISMGSTQNSIKKDTIVVELPVDSGFSDILRSIRGCQHTCAFRTRGHRESPHGWKEGLHQQDPLQADDEMHVRDLCTYKSFKNKSI